MKAILVIDNMPSCCWECQFEHFGLCMGTVERNTIEDMNVVLDGCPLKPIPSKRKSMVEWIDAKVKTHEFTEYDKGWNDCVEFLEGEEND